ncbi:MAG: hypothetical protein JWM28_3096 [Chitinophagaceae bacterium]|nr:hypothetical protein [Chitinophagaceae bacterium]
MKYYPLLPFLIFCMVITLNCGIKTKLSKSELKWLDVYNKGDSLIFRSEKNEFDTTVIIKKEFFYPTYNPAEEHGTYLPQWGVVWCINKNLEYDPHGNKLITITKNKPNETSLDINYLYSNVMILDLNSDIKKYKKGKVYEFDTYHPKASPRQPKIIFWDEEYGIIRYITHSGVVWERINLPK